MPFDIHITGENAVHAAAEIRNFLASMQLSVKVPTPGDAPVAIGAANVAAPVESAKAEKPKAAEKAPAKAAAKAKEEPKPESGPTLEDVMTRVRGLGENGENKEVLKKLGEVARAFGITKLKDLPPAKFQDYLDALEKEFPAEEAADDSEALNDLLG